MGEIAESMLDGTLCQGCGEFLGEAGPGYPRYCASCKESEIKPLVIIPPAKMANRKYYLMVWPYLGGQFRIHLIPKWSKNPIRECCTYKMGTAIEVTGKLSQATDPEAFLQSLATPENCEGPGGRIRLDPPKGKSRK